MTRMDPMDPMDPMDSMAPMAPTAPTDNAGMTAASAPACSPRRAAELPSPLRSLGSGSRGQERSRDAGRLGNASLARMLLIAEMARLALASQAVRKAALRGNRAPSEGETFLVGVAFNVVSKSTELWRGCGRILPPQTKALLKRVEREVDAVYPYRLAARPDMGAGRLAETVRDAAAQLPFGPDLGRRAAEAVQDAAAAVEALGRRRSKDAWRTVRKGVLREEGEQQRKAAADACALFRGYARADTLAFMAATAVASQDPQTAEEIHSLMHDPEPDPERRPRWQRIPSMSPLEVGGLLKEEWEESLRWWPPTPALAWRLGKGGSRQSLVRAARLAEALEGAPL